MAARGAVPLSLYVRKRPRLCKNSMPFQFQESSDHYPTRNNRMQRILEGRNFESGLRFSFLHSLGQKQSFAFLAYMHICYANMLGPGVNTLLGSNFFLAADNRCHIAGPKCSCQSAFDMKPL